MRKLSTRQNNNLITGNSLAIEILSTSDDVRAFVVIGAYKYNDNGLATKVSKRLNNKENNILFWLRKYEIKKEYIENEWDVSEDELINSIFIDDIVSVEELENKLSTYLDDYSGFDVEWKCDNPI